MVALPDSDIILGVPGVPGVLGVLCTGKTEIDHRFQFINLKFLNFNFIFNIPRKPVKQI
jgi:hypothetical protein